MGSWIISYYVDITLIKIYAPKKSEHNFIQTIYSGLQKTYLFASENFQKSSAGK